MRRHQGAGARGAGPGGLAGLGAPGGERGLRLQELIREEVSSILRDEVQDPRIQDVRITGVELSVDASRARLWYTTDGPDTESRRAAIEAGLTRATRFLRARLAESIALKRTPDLVFRRDPATHAFDQDVAAPH